MKAIVLSCDKYVKITDHMIHTYQKLWPSNSFTFRVPYADYPYFLKDKYGEKIELIQTEAARITQIEGAELSLIRATLLALLADIPDEEWVYWCMDDKYLVKIKEKDTNMVYDWVRNIKDASICGVTFCRCRCLLENKNLRANGKIVNNYKQVFIERKDYSQWWLHQFFRTKVLKKMFESFPDRPFPGREMDYFLAGKKIPPDQKLYVSEKNLVVFGESTWYGKLTWNCVNSFKKWGLEIPGNFGIDNQERFRGTLGLKTLLPRRRREINIKNKFRRFFQK